MDKIFQGDAVGFLFTSTLFVEYLSASGGNFAPELMDVQKVGNVLHFQLLTRLTDVTVGSEIHSIYYLFEEFYMVSNPPNLYVIHAMVPSPEPTLSPDIQAQLSSWFSKLAIVCPKVC